MNMIEFRQVYKSFGSNTALDGLDLEIQKGEVFALLGHNGAGKTTALRLALGLLKRDGGAVLVDGVDPFAEGDFVRSFCGVLAEDTGLYEPLTVYENLVFYAQIYGMKQAVYEPRIDELLELFDLRDKKMQVIRGFSTGMKKKVALIRAFLHNPNLLLLDEPTNGLDPVSIEKLRDLIRLQVDQHGATVVMTTHNLAEVQKTCDRIAILRKGRNVYANSVQHLQQHYPDFDLEAFYLKLESEAEKYG